MQASRLPKETLERMADSLQRYWGANFDEDIGDLKTTLLLQFILDEIAPSVYNLAIRDAQTYLQEKISDLEVNYYCEEFSHPWTGTGKRSLRKR
jgi:uncharacterized protein (DUF2164 family)